MAPHGDTTWFTPEPGTSSRLDPLVSREAWKPEPPPRSARLPVRERAREPTPAGRTCPPELRPVACSPGGAAEQHRPRIGAGRCISARPVVFIGMWSGASRKPSGRPALGKWIAN